LICPRAEESQGIHKHLARASFLYRQNQALREDWLLAAPGVDSELRNFGETVNSEYYSAISRQTEQHLRNIVQEFFRFWIAWRNYLCASSNSRFLPGDQQKRPKKILLRAAGFLLESRNP
jgi:hypothetical protein